MGDKITVKGGCHCGHARYEAKVTREALATVTRCNCTFCQKLATSGVRMDEADFTLLAPASKAELSNYGSGTPDAAKYGQRWFCPKCGAHVWMQAEYEMNGQRVKLFMISIRSVDQPQEGVELSEVKFNYFDGLHDNWTGGVKDTPWAGGLL